MVVFVLMTMMQPYNCNAQPCKEVIGYYPGWQWYDRTKLVRPETIHYSKYTIINYAFLYPLPDGTITITDPWGDKNLLLGSINWSLAPAGYDSSFDLGNPAFHNPGTSLIYHAHEQGVPVLISLGGWTLSSNFPGVAADPVKRANFAHWCNELVRIYDIDGIDIDWEYPGFADHAGTPQDEQNFTLLLDIVRDSLDALEPLVGKSLMLTAAVTADPAKMEDVEWNNIVPLLDYINLMSYDFFGAFSPETNHNAPLYAPAAGDPDFNCHSAVQHLIEDYGVPAEKLNMGVAFYGRSVTTPGASSLHTPNTGAADLVTFAADEGTPLYYNVLNSLTSFQYNWDEQAQVPYLTGLGGLNTFLSFDDEKSIGLKGQYIVDHGLAGAIIWEITGDYIETAPGSGVISNTPLTDTLNLSLCHAPTDTTSGGGSGGDPDASVIEVNDLIQIYPNPAQDFVIIKANNMFAQVRLYDINGNLVCTYDELPKLIPTDVLLPGIYLIELRHQSGQLSRLKFAVI